MNWLVMQGCCSRLDVDSIRGSIGVLSPSYSLEQTGILSAVGFIGCCRCLKLIQFAWKKLGPSYGLHIAGLLSSRMMTLIIRMISISSHTSHFYAVILTRTLCRLIHHQERIDILCISISSRAGLMNEVTGVSTLAIPSSVSAIYEQFDVSISRDDSESKYEFFFNTAGDETREKTLRMEPFVVVPGKGHISQKSEEDSIAYAKALIKVHSFFARCHL
jgi:hypothetical protein